MKNKDRIAEYEKTYAYKSLMEKHFLDELGMWEVFGEDPNCDFGGSHHEPHLCYTEGKLRDVIAYAVELPGFWQWGSGGRIKKVETIIRVDASSVAERRKKLARIAELRKELELLESEV